MSSQDASGKIQEYIRVLSELVNNRSSDGKKLLEETRDDLKRVLEEKAKKAQKIVVMPMLPGEDRLACHAGEECTSRSCASSQKSEFRCSQFFIAK